jgi:UDP-N-acetylglucosamine--N-acetylmuramyl-(pentapeptide) pyrophosphoryl-undecaprenol N-acetylglucosamine transferase
MAAPVMIMAGGTGGHIFPGLAVAAALRAQDVPVVWLGAEGGLETRLVPAAGLPIETVQVAGVRGKGLARRLRAPWMLLRAVWQARRVLRRHRPRCVLSMGGYAAGPGGIAAWLARRPLLVHEQNRVPGLTNRVLAQFARRVLAGFPDAFPASAKLQVVGNPVRAEIARLAAPGERYAGRGEHLRLLVLGGSQGARALNRALPTALRAQPAGRWEVRHQCGERFADEARAAYAEAGVAASVEPFITDMAAAYAWADLVVCRAGALTIAELAAAGVAAVLVPYPHAVDDHQTRNADFLVEAGAAQRLAESAELGTQLAALLPGLADRARLQAMAAAERSRAQVGAAEQVAALCLAEGRA